jgi:chemotaxis protein methyltransferase CheR
MSDKSDYSQYPFANFQYASLNDYDFNRLSNFIVREYGIKMPPVKKVLLQSRLQRRLKALNFKTFREYVDYVFSPQGQQEEVIHMMDVVSTNKTDFFRETSHFDYLAKSVLPQMTTKSSFSSLKIWSAGCSSGEEPYTLAIVLSEFAKKTYNFDFSILATDISTRMLKLAVEGIYDEDKIQVIPEDLKKKYFLRSKNHEEKKVRLIPEIRNKITFRRLNLISDRYSLFEKYDIIFCRNVLIYFEREIQYEILQRLCLYLKTHGYLFLGHSESIIGFSLPLKTIMPTVFYKI